MRSELVDGHMSKGNAQGRELERQDFVLVALAIFGKSLPGVVSVGNMPALAHPRGGSMNMVPTLTGSSQTQMGIPTILLLGMKEHLNEAWRQYRHNQSNVSRPLADLKKAESLTEFQVKDLIADAAENEKIHCLTDDGWSRALTVVASRKDETKFVGGVLQDLLENLAEERGDFRAVEDPAAFFDWAAHLFSAFKRNRNFGKASPEAKVCFGWLIDHNVPFFDNDADRSDLYDAFKAALECPQGTRWRAVQQHLHRAENKCRNGARSEEIPEIPSVDSEGRYLSVLWKMGQKYLELSARREMRLLVSVPVVGFQNAGKTTTVGNICGLASDGLEASAFLDKTFLHAPVMACERVGDMAYAQFLDVSLMMEHDHADGWLETIQQNFPSLGGGNGQPEGGGIPVVLGVIDESREREAVRQQLKELDRLQEKLKEFAGQPVEVQRFYTKHDEALTDGTCVAGQSALPLGIHVNGVEGLWWKPEVARQAGASEGRPVRYAGHEGEHFLDSVVNQSLTLPALVRGTIRLTLRAAQGAGAQLGGPDWNNAWNYAHDGIRLNLGRQQLKMPQGWGGEHLHDLTEEVVRNYIVTGMLEVYDEITKDTDPGDRAEFQEQLKDRLERIQQLVCAKVQSALEVHLPDCQRDPERKGR